MPLKTSTIPFSEEEPVVDDKGVILGDGIEVVDDKGFILGDVIDDDDEVEGVAIDEKICSLSS